MLRDRFLSTFRRVSWYQPLYLLCVVLAFFFGLNWRSLHETSLYDVARSFDPYHVLASAECQGFSEKCCSKKVYDSKLKVEVCVLPYKQEVDVPYKVQALLNNLVEERESESWVEDTYFSPEERGLFGYVEHNLSSLVDCLVTRQSHVARPHIAFIGDSHSRKRYLALTEILGKGVGEGEVFNCGPCHNCNGTCAYHCAHLCNWGEGWDAHMHHSVFPLGGSRSFVVSYAFWFKFQPSASFERFEEKIKRLEVVTGRPVTTTFVNSGHWHLQEPNPFKFCLNLNSFVEDNLAPLLKRGVKVIWISSGPVNYGKLDMMRAGTWHPRMVLGVYECSRGLFASVGASPTATQIPFVDIYVPGLSLMHKMESDGYHASPPLAKFQVQLALNHMCPRGAASSSGGLSTFLASRGVSGRS